MCARYCPKGLCACTQAVGNGLSPAAVIHLYDMGLRTVRLDEESERLLAEIRRETGTSVSGALKRGLEAAYRQLRERGGQDPYEIFSRLDLGPGGSARAPGRKAKQSIAALAR